MGEYKKKEPQLWLCYMSHYLMDVLPPVCHNVAMWLTVLLAAQRYIYVQHPTLAPDWCTLTLVKRASVIILLISLLPMTPKFYEVTFEIYVNYTLTMMNPSTRRLNGSRLSGNNQ